MVIIKGVECGGQASQLKGGKPVKQRQREIAPEAYKVLLIVSNNQLCNSKIICTVKRGG